MSTIGDRIKEIRGKRTTREFAEMIGVTNAIVSLWENGRRNVPESKILQISEKFSVSEAWLRTGEGEPFKEKTRDQQIEDMVNEIMAEKPEDFRRRFIHALTALDVEGWKAVEEFIDQVAAQERAGDREEPAPESGLKYNKEMSREDFLREAARQWDEKHGKVTPGSGTSTPTRSGTA